MAGRRDRLPAHDAAAKRRFARDLGRRIRALRLAEVDLSVRELARRIGKSATYVSAVERGTASPPTEAMIREMAQVLRARPEELITLAGRIPRETQDFMRVTPWVLALVDLLRRAEEPDPRIRQMFSALATRKCDFRSEGFLRFVQDLDKQVRPERAAQPARGRGRRRRRSTSPSSGSSAPEIVPG